MHINAACADSRFSRDRAEPGSLRDDTHVWTLLMFDGAGSAGLRVPVAVDEHAMYGTGPTKRKDGRPH